MEKREACPMQTGKAGPCQSPDVEVLGAQSATPTYPAADAKQSAAHIKQTGRLRRLGSGRRGREATIQAGFYRRVGQRFVYRIIFVEDGGPGAAHIRLENNLNLKVARYLEDGTRSEERR